MVYYSICSKLVVFSLLKNLFLVPCNFHSVIRNISTYSTYLVVTTSTILKSYWYVWVVCLNLPYQNLHGRIFTCQESSDFGLQMLTSPTLSYQYFNPVIFASVAFVADTLPPQKKREGKKPKKMDMLLSHKTIDIAILKD